MTSYRERLEAGVYDKAKPSKAATDKADATAEKRATSSTTSAKTTGLSKSK